MTLCISVLVKLQAEVHFQKLTVPDPRNTRPRSEEMRSTDPDGSRNPVVDGSRKMDDTLDGWRVRLESGQDALA